MFVFVYSELGYKTSYLQSDLRKNVIISIRKYKRITENYVINHFY